MYLEKKNEKIQKIKSEHRKEQIARVKEGKNPYFLTRSKLKQKLQEEVGSNKKKRKRSQRKKKDALPWKRRNENLDE